MKPSTIGYTPAATLRLNGCNAIALTRFFRLSGTQTNPAKSLATTQDMSREPPVGLLTYTQIHRHQTDTLKTIPASATTAGKYM